MGSSHAGSLSNWADGRQCKADGLKHRKQWVHGYHLLGFYYLSYTLRWCTPLKGALVVHSGPGVITESPSGCFWDRWKFFSLKLFTCGCQDQGKKAPVQHSFLSQVHMKLAQLPPLWGMLGHVKHSHFGKPPHVQSYHKKRYMAAGRWCSRVWPEAPQPGGCTGSGSRPPPPCCSPARRLTPAPSHMGLPLVTAQLACLEASEQRGHL